jgi:hypothetical protein
MANDHEAVQGIDLFFRGLDEFEDGGRRNALLLRSAARERVGGDETHGYEAKHETGTEAAQGRNHGWEWG